MMRITILICFFIMLFATSVPVLSQGIPGCYQPPFTRTVQVDVPVPCPPVGCGPAVPCPPNPCAPPVCAPPCPTRPVQVRVDVVVRPEVPKPCLPQPFCCENPPVFEPIFCQAAGLVQSLIAAPLALGERFMGHCVPMPLPAPCPVPCWSLPPAACSPCLQPPPATQCRPPCPPPVWCAPPGPPVKVRPSCVPGSARTYPPNGPFLR